MTILWWIFLVSFLLLLATILSTRSESRYRYAVSGSIVLGLCLLLPGIRPPVGLYVLIGLLWVVPFLKQHLVEWRRIMIGLSVFFSVSLFFVMLVRLIKEALFGSVANTMRPAFEAVGSLFMWTLPPTDQIGQKTDKIPMDLSKAVPQEIVRSSTLHADTLFFLNLSGVVLSVLSVCVTCYLIRKRRIVPKETEQTVHLRTTKRPLAVKTHSRHPLLKIASQLEQAFPRRHDETTAEWLTRIDFPEVEHHARLIDGIEFSRREPVYDIQLFRKSVRDQIER